MHSFNFKLLILFYFLISNHAYADAPASSEYLTGGKSKFGLILCHGKGKSPTWKVVNPLRVGVNDKLGYHTLSLQMPNENKLWKEYADDFEQAYKIIKTGIQFLKNEHGVENIYLMGHSMGSRMVSAFMAENPDQPIKGLIIAGCRNNGGYPLACDNNLGKVKIPVLDIWGSGNTKDDDAASERQNLVSVIYKQVAIANANHKFEGHDSEFVAAVVQWLNAQ